MELQRFRHFIVLAEEMNFGRAAQRLGMGQPLLSKSIQRLESRVGVALLDRSRRQIKLTAAGSSFLREARQALAHADMARRMAVQAAAGEGAQLRLTYLMPALFDVLPVAIREYRARWPTVAIRLEEQAADLQLAGLAEGLADLAVLRPYFPGHLEIESDVILRSRYVAAVPSDWPHAAKPHLTLAELGASPLILSPRTAGADLYDALYRAFLGLGIVPEIVQEVRPVMSRMSLVACGLGISLVSEDMKFVEMRGVRLVPVLDLPDGVSSMISVAWVPRRLTPESKNMLDILRGKSF